MTVRETGTSLAGCTSSQTGTYDLNFVADCSSANVGLVSESCSLRGMLLGGSTFTRV